MSVQAISWVLDHSNAELGTRLVAISVANHADKFGSNAWAAVQTYASEARLSKRQAQRALAALTDAGELREVGEHGYRADRMTKVYEFSDMVDGVTDRHPVEQDGVTSSTSRGDILDVHGVTPTSPNPSLEPSTNRPKNKDLALVDLFDAFWDVYPRHDGGRGRAFKAWEKASRKTTGVVIYNGAVLYRDDPNREDAYTAHASTWLNQERWDDPPLPSRVTRKPDAAAELLREALRG